MPCSQSQIFNGLGKALPPLLRSHLFYIFNQISEEVKLQMHSFVNLVVNIKFSTKLSKRSRPKTLMSTVSHASLPCWHKQSEAWRSTLEMILGHFGVKLAPSLTADALSVEGIILVERRCWQQSVRPQELPEAPRAGAGGVPRRSLRD